MSQSTAWLMLVIAGALDVGWAISMKYAEGYTRAGWSLPRWCCSPPSSSCSGVP